MPTPNNLEFTDDSEELSAPENVGEDRENDDVVSQKANDRTFRDEVIEKEEIRWYTSEKQAAIIRQEKSDIQKGLAEYASNIESGIKNRKEPLARLEELPQFLRECGVKDETVRSLEKAFPNQAEGEAPKVKILVTSLYDTINSLCDKPSFPEGTFSAKVLQTFEIKRKANFVADETAHVKYLDRHGEGYYSSDEGQEFMLEKANEEINPDSSLEEAA
ncbi:hypothetical protein ACFL21_02015 [Patescibacteria group bacterium]